MFECNLSSALKTIKLGLMKFKKYVPFASFAVSMLFTISCTSTADIDLEPQKITILQTADIHGQVFPHSELFFNEGEISYKTLGGLANMKTLFNEERSMNPNTIK